MNYDITPFICGKEERRKRQAALPYLAKVRIVVEMQKRRAEIVAIRGIHARVWDIEDQLPQKSY